MFQNFKITESLQLGDNFLNLVSFVYIIIGIPKSGKAERIFLATRFFITKLRSGLVHKTSDVIARFLLLYFEVYYNAQEMMVAFDSSNRFFVLIKRFLVFFPHLFIIISIKNYFSKETKVFLDSLMSFLVN